MDHLNKRRSQHTNINSIVLKYDEKQPRQSWQLGDIIKQ